MDKHMIDASAVKLTPKQREALEEIRDWRCSGIPNDPDGRSGIYGPRLGRINTGSRYLVDWNWGMVRRLEERGLITRHPINQVETHFELEITDAGRVALGDWAAEGRSS
jgi:hypothetical protein